MKDKPLKVYLMGSMRNPRVQDIATRLRLKGFDVFDDWQSPGPEADDHWQAYERARGRSYKEALYGVHATTVFELDKKHLDEADIAVMIMPCGKSAHLEAGWKAKTHPVYILFDEEPERYDIMYRFATDIFFDEEELLQVLSLELRRPLEEYRDE